MESDWKKTRLGDLISVTHGYAFKGDDFSEANAEGPIVVTIGNFDYTGGFRFKSTKIKRCNSEYPAEYELMPGDILLVMTCQTEGGEILGIPGIIPDDNETYLHNQRLGKVIIKAREVSSKYLYWLFLSRDFNLQLCATATGTKILHTAPKRIESFVFDCPPLHEQKAIAHILGSLDDKIELNRRMNATLEGMAQALFNSWFVDFDPVIDNALAAGNSIPEELAERAEVRRKALADGTANREAARQFPAAFQLTEEMGWIPEGWETMTLNQAIKINPSVKLSKGTVAPFADMKALPTDGYSINGVIKKAYSGGAKFQNDDVLLARITPCLENGKTGIVDFLPNPNSVGFGSTEFIVLRGKGEMSLPYVACLSREENFRLHCIQSMVGSSGRQRVQNACFDSFYVACTTDNVVLKKFSEITQPMFQKATEQSRESHTLTKLRDTLLPKLISGELRIPEAEKLTEDVA